MNTIKGAVCTTPILRYYSLNEEVMIQCYFFTQFGDEATLMQNGQPVSDVSRALTEAEIRYAQVEMEFLAIL